MGGGASELPLPLYGAFQCLKGFLVVQDLGNRFPIDKASKCVCIYICLQIFKVMFSKGVYIYICLQIFKVLFSNICKNKP